MYLFGQLWAFMVPLLIGTVQTLSCIYNGIKLDKTFIALHNAEISRNKHAPHVDYFIVVKVSKCSILFLAWYFTQVLFYNICYVSTIVLVMLLFLFIINQYFSYVIRFTLLIQIYFNAGFNDIRSRSHNMSAYLE